MAQAPASSPAVAPVHEGGARFLPWLLILFAGSGCSALIYEIAWYQMLQLVIGSTAVSLGVLLATFMGGLCIGSLALPRWLTRHRREHPLRVYALLEFGTGVLGLLGLWFIPLIDRAYVVGAEHGLPSMMLRGLLCGLCLLPPTILMGASLPAITSWLENTPRGVAWWGLLYGGNIAGAVFGCLLAGYYVLRVYNLDTAVALAATINLVVAVVGLSVAQRAPASAALESPAERASRPERARVGSRATVMLVIALSGCGALGAEVVWTRLMGLLLGATVYTFSLILAVFLIGLGVGSGFGAWLGRRVRSAGRALGWCQWALALAVAWAAWMIAASLPYWPINPDLSTSPWYIFQIDLVRCVWTILPAAILWGASFPLALAAAEAAAPDNADSGRLVGEVYAANTLGAIVGALAFSLFLIPWIGTQHCESLLIALSAVGGVLLTVDSLNAKDWRPGLVFGTLSVVAIVLILTVRNIPGELIAYGREVAEEAGLSKILYTGEGRNSSIAVSRWDSDGTLQFHVDGKVVASTDPADMKLQRMLGHVPALLHGPGLKSVLVVGFGAGVTAGSFTLYPSVKHITICELEPLVPPAATKYFSAQNYDVMNDPRTHIVYDDARHFVLTDPHKYDLITADPIHPWVKGSAALYTRNYFQMERDHLNPGGIVTQWVPLYESDAAAVKSEIASFFAVFPNGTLWANTVDGGGYDTYLLGSNAPYQINVDQLQAELNSPAYAKVEASMQQVGMGTAYAIASTFVGNVADLKPWLANAQINTDDNLRLQYLAGLALNEDKEDSIFNTMLQYRRFPSHLIVGSPQSLAPLKQLLGSPADDSSDSGQ